MGEGLFQPFHLLIILFITAMFFGIVPFLAGYFLGRYMEAKKPKTPSLRLDP
jgi:hypothetical protein